jgi:fumarate reductase subunit C
MGVRRQAKRGNLMSSTQEMTRERGLVAGVGLAERPRKSRWPAKLDWAQSASGLLLGLFMWGHMFFVSSILISPDAMWMVTKAFEGYFFFGTSHPILVSGVVAVVLALLVGHAALAMRKLPGSWKQLQTFAAHRKMLAHEDTTLWWVQALTGFALFFMATVHLYQMLMHPGAIGPYESAARVWHGWWPLYLVLLLAVELHGGIGLYRLAVKWGWFEGRRPGRLAPPAAHRQVAADGLLPGAGPVHAAGLPAHRPGAAASREPRLHTRLAGQSAHGARRPPGGQATSTARSARQGTTEQGQRMKVIYTDVLVIGGGLAGLRLAIGAKRRGHEATILSLVPPKRSHSGRARAACRPRWAT